ncbi:MAG: HNH endonuclease [Candidatus Peribacteraceae bacterium]|nr:HNH endonuclease [Candidatus Peribacteraceae bacterium]
MNVLVLDPNFQEHNVVDWKKAIKYLVKGTAEVIEYYDKVIRNTERTFITKIPKVMRLLKLEARVYRTHIPFSKPAVLIRDGYKCIYCGTNKKRLTIDHILPKSRGGDHRSFENTVACCEDCNCTKGDRTPEEAGMKLLKRVYTPTVYEYLIKKMKM